MGSAPRGRPGRRTAKERREAVLALLSGKASLDQLGAAYGVRLETVEGWRQQALLAIETALARGDAKSPRERDLERENKALRDVVSTLSVERELALRAVEECKRTARPSRPARWRR